MSYTPRTPIWMGIVIALAMIPALIFPFRMGAMPTDATARYLIWFYPAYVIGSGVCAWLCYPQRKALAWILIVLMILSHMAMYMLENI